MSDGGVQNEQLANENTFNAGFMSRNGTQTDTVSKIDLLNADAPSGPTQTNIQRLMNSLASMTRLITL